MKSIFSKIVVYLFFGICISCIYEPKIDVLNVYNRSEATIFIIGSCDKNLNLEHPVKLFDTVYSKAEKRYNIISPMNKFYPYSIQRGGLLRKNWKQYVNHCPDKKVRFFVVDANVVANEKWPKIVKEEMYSKVMEYSEHQLDSLNWFIEYGGE